MRKLQILMFTGVFLMISHRLNVYVCEVFDIHNWNYEELGPDEWLADFPQCKGIQQSPINIVSSRAVYNASLKPFEFIFYDMNLKLNFSNNGHTSIILQKKTIILNKSYLWKKRQQQLFNF
jgi:carbonic anhydrase